MAELCGLRMAMERIHRVYIFIREGPLQAILQTNIVAANPFRSLQASVYLYDVWLAWLLLIHVLICWDCIESTIQVSPAP